jgi:hypothetical protein
MVQPAEQPSAMPPPPAPAPAAPGRRSKKGRKRARTGATGELTAAELVRVVSAYGLYDLWYVLPVQGVTPVISQSLELANWVLTALLSCVTGPGTETDTWLGQVRVVPVPRRAELLLAQEGWRPVALSKADRAPQAALSDDRLSVTSAKGFRMARPPRARTAL